MRLWCLHPRYLDTKGLVACWREGLLARKVLLGETKGYRRHPQLDRFQAQTEPIMVLDSYLLAIYKEAGRRGFMFSRQKIGPCFSRARLKVTDGQLHYEWQHLRGKLRVRDVRQHTRTAGIAYPLPHPIFRVVKGDIEAWERVH
jgi:Pyrimidine dimer DNA glycosylase